MFTITNNQAIKASLIAIGKSGDMPDNPDMVTYNATVKRRYPKWVARFTLIEHDKGSFNLAPTGAVRKLARKMIITWLDARGYKERGENTFAAFFRRAILNR